MRLCLLIPLFLLYLANPAFAAGKKPLATPGEQIGGNNLALLLIEEIVKNNPEYELTHPITSNSPAFSKVLADFEAGDLDIVWTLASKEYEQKYQAVYYPLYMGMFGMRLPIVKKSEVDQFANVKDLEDLRQFTAGQGKDWADTPILKSNGIRVVEVNKYLSHFPMLEGDRFDYFPRAIHEPWSEVERESQYNLTVEAHIMLRYRAPFYLFVRKEDQALFRYLSEGMEQLTQSGRHRELFFAEQSVQMALSNSNLEARTIIDLNNPELTSQTPIDRKELWFDPLTDSAD